MVSKSAITPVAITQFEGRLFLRAEEAAAALGISDRHFRAMVQAGEIPPPVKLGRCNLWSVAKLAAIGDRR